MAGQDGKTGSINEDDLNTYLGQNDHETQAKANAQTLHDDTTISGYLGNGLSQEDLKKVVADSTTSPTAKSAAQFFIDNPKDFAKVSGAANPAGESDTHISKEDLEAYLKPHEALPGSPADTANAMKQLTTDHAVTFPLSIGDLEGIRDDTGGKYSPETKKAAQYLLDNRAEFDSVDRSSDNSLDSIVSKDDALNYLVPPVSPENTKAMTDALTHNGSLKWPLTLDSLKEIANNDSVNLDTRTAAKYFVNHPEEFNKVGIFKSIDGVAPPPENSDANAAWAADKLRDPNATIYRANGQTVEQWDGLTADDLYGIANNSANSADVRNAALFFAQHGERFDATDSLEGSKDGMISRGDLDKYYYKETPLYQAPYEDKNFDKYYDPILYEYMHDNGIKTLPKEELEHLRDDLTKDIHLREAADYWLRFKLTPDYQTAYIKDVNDDIHGRWGSR